ncbi:MAG: rRNA maturation RNase YbeY [Acholeplasmataceae bacterium]
MKINIFNNTNQNLKKITKKIKQVFKKIKDKNKLNLIFIDDLEMIKLNQYYRKKDNTTDVLSFPNSDDEKFLGDIFINIDQANLQALDYEHSVYRETAFLAVHGYLHLIGYNHQTKEDELIMINKQKEILNQHKL